MQKVGGAEVWPDPPRFSSPIYFTAPNCFMTRLLLHIRDGGGSAPLLLKVGGLKPPPPPHHKATLWHFSILNGTLLNLIQLNSLLYIFLPICIRAIVFKHQTSLYPTHACKEFNEQFPKMFAECGYRFVVYVLESLLCEWEVSAMLASSST